MNHVARRDDRVNIAGGENPELDLRKLRAVLLNLLQNCERDSTITAVEAALAYQGEFAHAVKAGKNAGYDFVLRGAARMERSLVALRSALRKAKPRVSARSRGV